MELRESRASSYTLRDTPTFTCVQMSLWDMLDTLGGAGSAQALSRRPARADGYTPVATLSELPPGAGRRVYAAGEAVALFNLNGTVHAIANRCTHARASLSEGTLDPARACSGWRSRAPCRSEEHTSELQSHQDLVCRLLLEKI